MRKTVALLILLSFVALIISACGKKTELAKEIPDETDPIQTEIPEPDPVPSEEPVPTPEPTPMWERGTAAGYGVGVLFGTAERGSEVEILGEEDAYCLVSFEGTELYVERRFIRNTADSFPEEYTAFARFGAEVYSGPYLTGDPLEKPVQNSRLTVVDELGDILLVRTDNTEGYIRSVFVSPVWISPPAAGGGGDPGQNGGSGAGSGEDGGDITLGNRRTAVPAPVMLFARFEDKAGSESVRPAKGTILADGTELYLEIVYPGDELMVLSAEGKTAEIYTPRGTGTLPRWAVLLGDEDPYKTWNGYATYRAKLYESYRLTGGYEDIVLNTEMTVIMETDNGFFVRLLNGEYGYAPKESVGGTMTAVYYDEPKSNGNDSPAAEWTEPVL